MLVTGKAASALAWQRFISNWHCMSLMDVVRFFNKANALRVETVGEAKATMVYP
jgi:hypothetical protein